MGTIHSSAAKSRGLIEAWGTYGSATPFAASSAAKSRGLIEAAASEAGRSCRRLSSAAKSRGLIEATRSGTRFLTCFGLFRGEKPRPH